MHDTITPAQMKELETRFMQETGVPGILLMEHAARGVVEALGRHVPKTARVLFLCGPGNNGGDGYAAARLWTMGGGEAAVWEVTDQQTGDAKIMRKLACYHWPRILIYGADEEFDFSIYDAYVDAVFGTGLSRPIDGQPWAMLHHIYDQITVYAGGRDKPVIAVDVPSGLNALTGEIADPLVVVPATETVTFHRPKLGLLLQDGPKVAGKITVHSIFIDQVLDTDFDEDEEYPGMTILEPSDLDDLPRMFHPAVTAHKGDMGRVVLFCGSRGMAGAAALCANAAMRTGAGLTNLLCRESILPILQTLAPAATCTILPEKDGVLLPEAADIARAALEKADAACIGCGLGQTEDLLPLLKVFAEAACPIVWDADALNLLAKQPSLLPLPAKDVVTPHPGEAARLLGCAAPEVTGDPLAALDRLHQLCGCTVLLKGARTLITDGENRFCNLYGTPAMAKGGSGDVLTGILTALLARCHARHKEDDETSGDWFADTLVAYAALIHGLAGIRAEKLRGTNSVLPTDLIENIRLDSEGI